MADLEKQGETVNALHTSGADPSTTASSAPGHASPSATYSNYLCYYYAGLSSDDPALKRRSQYMIYGHVAALTIVVVGVILTFTVVIPAVMQNLVNQSELNLYTATITNPSNYSFNSAVLGKFTNAGSIAADVKMNTLTVSWNGVGGGDMLKLTHSNTLHIENNHQATMNSLSTVYDMEAFSNFNTYLIHSESAEWTIDGTADVTFLITSTVNFHKQVTLVGANNFSTPPIVHTTNVTNGTTHSLLIASDVTMFSQSNVELNLGQTLYFDLIYNDVQIGTGYIPNYQMIQGPFSTVAYLSLSYSTPQQYQQICNLMSNYSCGITVNASMQNFYLQPSLIWLKPALASVTMNTQLPGCASTLVKKIYLFNQRIPENLPYEMVLYNPQPISMTITAITGKIFYLGVNIATVNNQNLQIVIPPYETITTIQLISNSVNNVQAVNAFTQLVSKGQGQVDLDNVIIGNFSEFKANIIYKQNNVTMIVIPYK